MIFPINIEYHILSGLYTEMEFLLGAVVYTLAAEQSGWLPEFTGRVMHGVFFRMLQEASQELASYVHEQMKMKTFSV